MGETHFIAVIWTVALLASVGLNQQIRGYFAFEPGDFSLMKALRDIWNGFSIFSQCQFRLTFESPCTVVICRIATPSGTSYVALSANVGYWVVSHCQNSWRCEALAFICVEFQSAASHSLLCQRLWRSHEWTHWWCERPAEMQLQALSPSWNLQLLINWVSLSISKVKTLTESEPLQREPLYLPGHAFI